jgi:glucosamine--fructose-6-phosphate aminotransferase (isomerizing)
VDCTGRLVVVSDGTIENAAAVAARLRQRGHPVGDDPAVVAHLIEEYRAQGDPLETALRRALDALTGRFAVAMLHARRQDLYVARRGAPLALGVGNGQSAVVSDPRGLSGVGVERVVALHDGDLAVCRPTRRRVIDANGAPVDRVEQATTAQGGAGGDGARSATVE